MIKGRHNLICLPVVYWFTLGLLFWGAAGDGSRESFENNFADKTNTLTRVDEKDGRNQVLDDSVELLN